MEYQLLLAYLILQVRSFTFCKMCLFQCKTLDHLKNVLFLGSQLEYIIIMILDYKIMLNVNGKSLNTLWWKKVIMHSPLLCIHKLSSAKRFVCCFLCFTAVCTMSLCFQVFYSGPYPRLRLLLTFEFKQLPFSFYLPCTLRVMTFSTSLVLLANLWFSHPLLPPGYVCTLLSQRQISQIA